MFSIKNTAVGCLQLLLGLTVLTSCRDFVTIDPPITSVSGLSVYKDNGTAASVLTGIYTQMSVGSFATGANSISVLTGLSSDELSLFGGTNFFDSKKVNLFTNSLNSVSFQTYWEEFFSRLHTVNSALEGLRASSDLNVAVKRQLMGEALFLRAFINFYLVNFYGAVPLCLTPDYRTNATISRSPESVVYDQIVQDLKEAKALLSADYLQADVTTVTTERVRPNTAVATALLARVYLYKGEWANAEVEAGNLINNTAVYDTVSLAAHPFQKNSREAIWQLQPVIAGWNTLDARDFILVNGPSSQNPVFLSEQLLQAFEPGDVRLARWIAVFQNATGSYAYPVKYQSATFNAPVTEYLMVFRLAEQYLIRAEARAHLGDMSGARADLNVIRKRAGLGGTAAADQTALLLAIERERQVELFSEWGHRWLDLKRTDRVDAVMPEITAAKGGVWSPNWKLYPIPQQDIIQNPNLAPNNPGY